MTTRKFRPFELRMLVLATLIIVSVSTPVAADSLDGNDLQKTVLVTGASSGIGRRITELLASNGYYVYAGARKQEAQVTIAQAIKELIELNQDQPHSYSRDQLVQMIDAAMARSN